MVYVTGDRDGVCDTGMVCVTRDMDGVCSSTQGCFGAVQVKILGAEPSCITCWGRGCPQGVAVAVT